MFYRYIIIIVFITIFQINHCLSAPYVNLVNTTVLPSESSFYSRGINICKVTLSVVLDSDKILLPSELSLFIADKPSLQTPTSRIINLQQQIFTYPLFNIFEGTYQLNLTVLNASLSLSQTFTLPYNASCKIIQRENFQFIQIKPIPLPIDQKFRSFLISFNYTLETGSGIIQCSTDDSIISCSCYLINPLVPQEHTCTFYLTTSGYSSLKPSVNVTLSLSFYNYVTSFIIDNPFPWNVTRTSTIKSVYTQPPNNYIFYEDYRLQRYSSMATSQIFTIEDMNSIITSQGSSFYLVSRNSTVSQYMALYPGIYTNVFNVLFLDSSSTIVVSNYSVTFQSQSIDSYVNSTFYKDDFTNTTMVKYEKWIPFNNIYSFGFYLYDSDIKISLLNYETSNKNNSFKYLYEVPLSNFYSGSIQGYISSFSNSGTFNFKQVNASESRFILNSVNILPSSPLKNVIYINISSNYPIRSMYIHRSVCKSNNNILIGDLYNSIFFCEFTVLADQLSFTVLNLKGDAEIFYQGQIYNSNLEEIPPSIFDPTKIILFQNDLTLFSLNKTSINLTNVVETTYNTLYFNLSKYVPDLIPIIKIGSSIQYYGSYDYSMKMFVITFPIPSWIIEGSSLQVSISNFENSVKSIAEMNIINPRGELIPPNLYKLLNFQNSTKIGWKLFISDTINGFKNGVANVVSFYDSSPIIINFNETNRISGDHLDGVYEIYIDIDSSNCRSQVYSLNIFGLYDGSPAIADYPLSSILGTVYEPNINISLICSGIPEYEPPKLVKLNFNPTIQVGGYNRMIEINFTTTDQGISGISKKNNPIIYLSSENGDQYQISSNLTSNNGSHFDYIARDQIPYGFGYRYIFISIYGIMDNQNNYASYSISDLRNNSFPYFIMREFDSDIPVIERVSPILNRGGSLTVYGKSLYSSTMKMLINYHDGNGYQQIYSTFNTSIIVQFTDIKEIKSPFFTIIIESNGIKSNEFKVSPIIPFKIPSPTPSPSPTLSPSPTIPSPSLCPGSPPCNNRGVCKENIGCDCQSPWYGPSCSSERIYMNPPTPQSVPTIRTNVVDSNKKTIITSSMSIKEIREIDADNNIIQRYFIENWNFTDLTSSQNPTYQYIGQFDKSKTIIKTTIIFFENQTNINFGSEILKMQPSTLKYTIELSQYQFKSSINSLQIILESIIKGEDQSSCSSFQFGSQNNTKNNVQWIKLDIGQTSLYGKFLDFGIIDNRVTKITNRIIEQDDESTSQTNNIRSIMVGITIPVFEQSVILDPDFSNLITLNDENNSNQICKSSKSKISIGAIIGIVVGCAALVLCVILFFVFKRRLSYKIKIMKFEMEPVKQK